MVKINECHYTLGHPNNFQERDIEYSSWSKYIVDIILNPKRQECTYQSLPVSANVDKIVKIDDEVFIIQYYHPSHGQYVEHVAKRK